MLETTADFEIGVGAGGCPGNGTPTCHGVAIAGEGRGIGLVKLDIAAAWLAAAQVAAGEVAIGQLDLEDVVAARHTLVADADPRGASLAINGHSVVNDPAIRIVGVNRIASDSGGLDVRAAAMVHVIQVAPAGAILDATGAAEFSHAATADTRALAPRRALPIIFSIGSNMRHQSGSERKSK